MKQWIINYCDTGDMITYLNGLVHSRHNEAAIIAKNGCCMWFFEGKLHRENGPAFIDPNSGVKEWWTHGVMTATNSRKNSSDGTVETGG